jgi:hypothetical protein
VFCHQHLPSWAASRTGAGCNIFSLELTRGRDSPEFAEKRLYLAVRGSPLTQTKLELVPECSAGARKTFTVGIFGPQRLVFSTEESPTEQLRIGWAWAFAADWHCTIASVARINLCALFPRECAVRKVGSGTIAALSI